MEISTPDEFTHRLTFTAVDFKEDHISRSKVIGLLLERARNSSPVGEGEENSLELQSETNIETPS